MNSTPLGPTSIIRLMALTHMVFVTAGEGTGTGGAPVVAILNAVVLRNTRYLDAAVAQLRAEGHDIKDEDVARLSRSRTGTSTS
jgi:hypothetical protein